MKIQPTLFTFFSNISVEQLPRSFKVSPTYAWRFHFFNLFFFFLKKSTCVEKKFKKKIPIKFEGDERTKEHSETPKFVDV